MIRWKTVIYIFQFTLPVAVIEMYLVKEEMCATMCLMPFHEI